MEAAQALEKCQEKRKKEGEGETSTVAGIDVTVGMSPNLPSKENDSDEELLLATLELEQLQLIRNTQGEPAQEAHHQGDGHHEDQHHGVGGDEVRQVPNLRPSLGMTESNLDGTQGLKGEQPCQATYGPGGHRGDVHHFVQDEGEGGDHRQQEEGAVGGTPSSPTPIGTPRTPPNTRRTQEQSSSPYSRFHLQPSVEEEGQGQTVIFIIIRSKEQKEKVPVT